MRNLRTRLNLLAMATLMLLSCLSVQAVAATPEEKGLSITIEADNRDSGFIDFTADMEMVLKNRHGQKSTRLIRVRTLEVENDGDKSLTIFDSPRDVKGTAFLNYTHKKDDDDQWLYLPALKRVKRISSRNRSGSFMGSEFAYEDISSQEIEKYTYRWLRDEILDDRACFVVDRYPVDSKNSGYTRQVIWIDKDEYRQRKIEYYDRKKSHLKTLMFSDYNRYIDRFWRAGKMVMVNHQSGKSTELFWNNYRFQAGLKARDFSKNSLKRAR
jgi:outer membrane lipoprotein-sorting protein